MISKMDNKVIQEMKYKKMDHIHLKWTLSVTSLQLYYIAPF